MSPRPRVDPINIDRRVWKNKVLVEAANNSLLADYTGTVKAFERNQLMILPTKFLEPLYVMTRGVSPPSEVGSSGRYFTRAKKA